MQTFKSWVILLAYAFLCIATTQSEMVPVYLYIMFGSVIYDKIDSIYCKRIVVRYEYNVCPFKDRVWHTIYVSASESDYKRPSSTEPTHMSMYRPD